MIYLQQLDEAAAPEGLLDRANHADRLWTSDKKFWLKPAVRENINRAGWLQQVDAEEDAEASH